MHLSQRSNFAIYYIQIIEYNYSNAIITEQPQLMAAQLTQPVCSEDSADPVSLRISDIIELKFYFFLLFILGSVFFCADLS
jgi:hypothetical protein